MHVTLVTGSLPTLGTPSGTRSYVLGLAGRLSRRGVSVSVVARGRSPELPREVQVLPVPTGATSAKFLAGLVAAAPGLPIPRDSVIHAQRPDDLVAFAVAKRGNPKVCTLHGIPGASIRRRKGPAYGTIYDILERFGLQASDRVIAVDRGTAKWYAKRYQWLEGRMSMIPVAVDTERFRPMDRDAARARFRIRADRSILFAGRLSPEKRVEWVLEALPGLEGVEFLVAGAGPEEERLRRLATRLPVRFLGSLPHEDMPELLNAADLLVLPSEYEGMATVALEALACGIPVVATSVGGIAAVVTPGRTGWLVGNLDEFVAAIAATLSKAATMREACVEAVAPYRWDAVVDRILAVYRDAEAAA